MHPLLDKFFHYEGGYNTNAILVHCPLAHQREQLVHLVQFYYPECATHLVDTKKDTDTYMYFFWRGPCLWFQGPPTKCPGLDAYASPNPSHEWYEFDDFMEIIGGMPDQIPEDADFDMEGVL